MFGEQIWEEKIREGEAVILYSEWSYKGGVAIRISASVGHSDPWRLKDPSCSPRGKRMSHNYESHQLHHNPMLTVE